jgi:hypothetical protein
LFAKVEVGEEVSMLVQVEEVLVPIALLPAALGEA